MPVHLLHLRKLWGDCVLCYVQNSFQQGTLFVDVTVKGLILEL